MTIAFFDLDRTVLSINSAQHWIKHLWKTNELGLIPSLRFSIGIIRYYFGSTTVEKNIREAITRLEGRNYEDIKRRVAEFYQQELQYLIRPGALEALEEHKSNNVKCALLTSSPELLGQHFTIDLGLDGCIATKFEVDEKGFFTGYPEGTICYGKGKIQAAADFAKANSTELSACTFYTDSITDLPTLELVNLPIAVNPDPSLRREAKKRNWKIVDWGKPSERTKDRITKK